MLKTGMIIAERYEIVGKIENGDLSSPKAYVLDPNGHQAGSLL